MDVRQERTVPFFLAALTLWFLMFPQPACAVEVGCFCTFVFASLMFSIGIGTTVAVKYLMARKFWRMTFKRTTLIAGLEVVLMLAVLIIIQTAFTIRVLVYLPLAFLLNYSLTAASDVVLPEQRTPKKRVVMAGISCLVLPLAVQVIAALWLYLSNLITFKEVSV